MDNKRETALTVRDKNIGDIQQNFTSDRNPKGEGRG